MLFLLVVGGSWILAMAAALAALVPAGQAASVDLIEALRREWRSARPSPCAMRIAARGVPRPRLIDCSAAHHE